MQHNNVKKTKNILTTWNIRGIVLYYKQRAVQVIFMIFPQGLPKKLILLLHCIGSIWINITLGNSSNLSEFRSFIKKRMIIIGISICTLTCSIMIWNFFFWKLCLFEVFICEWFLHQLISLSNDQKKLQIILVRW